MRSSIAKLTLAAVLSIVFFAGRAHAQSPDKILGVWLTPNGPSKVEIKKCGELYCGSIISMETPRNDQRNEDPAKRGRSLVGVEILSDFKHDGGTNWSGGRIYAPERGNTLNAKLVLVKEDTLEVRVSAGLVKRTITWTRAK